MSFATIMGVIAALVLFLGSIFHTTSNPAVFIDPPGFFMTVGGTLAATFIAYEPRYVMMAFKLMYRIVFAPKMARGILTAEVGRMIKWGYVVQKGGLPALEQAARGSTKGDRFLTFGLELVVSQYEGHDVREILTNAIETTFQRNSVPAEILKAMGGAAPAFGMIGTLIGLMVMLDNLNDPSAVGPGMAVALNTTLYGVAFARLVLLPAAAKIQQREDIVRFRNYLVAEGLCLLADRKSPRYIQDRMNSFLDPAIHFNIDKMRG